MPLKISSRLSYPIFWRKLAHFSHFSLYNQNLSNWFLVKIGQNTKAIALLLAKVGPFYPLFTLQSKSVKLIFGENWAKYQGYSLTFWRKLGDFSHFSLYNQNLSNWFLVKIGQNTKAIALLLAKIGPFYPLFTLQSKSVKLIFGENWAKYQGYSLTFWRKLGDFSHFSLYNQNLSNWFLVKIGQNTKAIALLLAKIGPFYPLFTLQSKSVKLIFGENWAKYQGYSLTFWRKLGDFSHFSLYNQNLSNWFLVKIGQNTKAIALLLAKIGPFYPLFTLQSKSVKLIFGENWAKYQGYSLTFWRKLGDFSHFSLYNQNLSNWFLVKIGQNTKAIALLLRVASIFAYFQSSPLICSSVVLYTTIKNCYLSNFHAPSFTCHLPALFFINSRLKTTNFKLLDVCSFVVSNGIFNCLLFFLYQRERW